jgi:F-type H+-transporting ATPase subunit b
MMSQNNKTIYLFFLGVVVATFVSTFAFAEEAEVHSGGIPRIVFYQALNFFGLIAILIYLVRSKVSAFFFERHKTLTAALTEAKKIREDAEKKHQEYTIKIQNLENQSDSLIDQIRREGEEAKSRMIEEAKSLAAAIEVESKRSAQNEIDRAKSEIYDDVLQQALTGAHTLLEKSIAANDQQRLQREFVEKIEAVQ